MTDRSVTREQLEQAIAAQEQLRGTLDDTVVDAAIGALRAHLDLLEADEAVAPRRRLATVMFVDIVDSTGLLRDRDPEETMTIMDSALQRLAAPVRRHGGRVTRFMGDGYLAVFGLPTSRENDPEMAVRAGLAVLDETTVVADELAKTHGLGRLGVRIGINTGLVVTGGSTEAADTIMGAEVNLAARLETAAPPNGLLISHGTYQHVRDRFVVERRGTIEAKGFLEPVAVYLVTGIEEPTRRGARPVVEGITAAFAGRDGELLGLERALDEAIGGAALTTVSVCGDAGIGKSRTVREFEDRLPSEVRTFRARAAAEDRDVPYALLKDLLVRYLGIRDGDGLEIVTGKLRAGTAEILDDDQATAVGRLVGFEIGDRPASDPKRLRDVGLRALGDLLRPTTQANVIVLEDLQWADEASLDAVDGLMAQLMMTPTLVVLVARPTFWAEQPRWDLAPGHRRIDVPPLDTSTCRSLVDDLLADVEGDTEAVAELLMTRSEGNPYYLEELVRMLVDDGVLVRAEGHWSTSAGELTGLRVPPTLTGVIQSRLDGLDRRERAALQRSSVIGRVFWEGAVVHLGGDGSALADLVDRDMIVAHATSAFGDTAEYAFRHTLLREVAYESVLLADRARLHGLAADWLADRAGERAGEFAGPIATHLEQAGRPVEAVGYLMRAAEIAWRSYAIDATVAFYRRAQDLAGDGATRCDIALGLAQAFRVQGDRVAEDALLTDAEEIARSAGDVVRVSRTLLQRAWYHYWNSDFDGMERAAEASAAAASDLEAPAALASARIARAWALMVLRRLPEAAAEAAAAEVVAREVGDRDVERSALNAVGLIAIASGEFSRARDVLDRYHASARADGDLQGEANALNGIGIAATMIGDFEAADAAFDQNLVLARDTGDRGSLVTSLVNRAWVHASRGRFDEARDFAEEGIAVARELGFGDAVAEGTMWLAHALGGLADVDAAHDAYARALDERHRLGQDELAAGAMAGLARTALARGDLDEARRHAEAILEQIAENPELPGTWEPLRIHLSVVQVLEAAGDDRAPGVLAGAYDLLMDRCERITDPGDRAMFLENIPWHREIIERTAG